MNWGPWLAMLGVLILGTGYTYLIAKNLADKKQDEKLSTMQLIEGLSVFKAACFIVFGPFVIVVRKAIRKMKDNDE